MVDMRERFRPGSLSVSVDDERLWTAREDIAICFFHGHDPTNLGAEHLGFGERQVGRAQPLEQASQRLDRAQLG
jgi:hypothetical protein